MADDESENNESFLHSRWRPVGAWICIAALGYELLMIPLLSLAWVVTGSPAPALVHVEKTFLLEMLGLFVFYRSFEKYHEVAAK